MKTNSALSLRARPPGLRTGFTLLELLVVMSIIALLAALSVPVMNSFKPNVTAAAIRQLLDDLARARQLAISQRTTVYMVFVPPNFCQPAASFWNSIAPADRVAVTNLLDKQLTGYAFVATRGIGDQPGQHVPRYLSEWRSLPEGIFIAQQKFFPTGFYVNGTIQVIPFTNGVALPFPSTTTLTPNIVLPCIAFNYMGQLTDGANGLGRNEIIPLAKGSVSVARDPATKTPTGLPLDGSGNTYMVNEAPRGNATDSSYNIVVVDWLTGRAHAERLEVQ